MNNPNPFVPKGSILEQQSKRRSRLKLAVFCVLAVSVSSLTVMLIQGCKREPAPETTETTPTIETNPPVMIDTNLPPMDTNPPAYVAPTNLPVVVAPPVVEPTGAEYTVVKGDFLDSIAKKHGVTLKALEAANPGVVPTKLKVGQKLVIPAGGAATPAAVATDSTASSPAGETYVVKSGDTLTKIAKQFGTTYKALETANNLSTTKIKVGQKLKIPAKAGAVAPAPVTPAPVYSEPPVSNTVPQK
ncbi:MAG: LysM peptidoglycan-binding domain-containing protein [Limisphaerales bacterium]